MFGILFRYLLNKADICGGTEQTKTHCRYDADKETGVKESILIAVQALTKMSESAEKDRSEDRRINLKRDNISVGASIFSSVFTAIAAAASCFAAHQSQKAVDIAQRTFLADQRPWISLDVDLAGSLAYDAAGWDAGPRWHVPLRYKLQQLGKTPATNVSVFGEVIPLRLTMLGADIAKEIELVCAFPEAMNDHEIGFGATQFPNETTSQIYGVNGNPARFHGAEVSGNDYSGQFMVVMCVTYGSTFDQSKYRTAKAFHLFKRSGNGMIDPNGEAIGIDDLGFVASPLSVGSEVR